MGNVQINVLLKQLKASFNACIGKEVAKMGNFALFVKLGDIDGDICCDLESARIRFPNNPNDYYIKKFEVEHIVDYVLKNYKELSWPKLHIGNRTEDKLQSIVDIYRKDRNIRKNRNYQNVSKEFEETVKKLTEYYADRFGFLYRDIKFVKLRTALGQCSKAKIITYNPIDLIQKGDSYYIKMVILHELCHTVHLNHGIKFWTLLEKKLYDADISYSTNFIRPEIFRRREDALIKLPLKKDGHFYLNF